MAFVMIMIAISIALTLLFIFIGGSGEQSFPENIAETIDWSAISDNELQSYLPGKKISAIKRYRKLTGAGLKEAKMAIDYAMANPDAKKGKRSLLSNTGGEGVRDLLLEGRFESAVDLYAAFMGVDEYTARDAVEAMQRELDAEANLNAEGFDNIRNLIANGKKIEAYKQYREQTGASLEEAKRFIELEL